MSIDTGTIPKRNCPAPFQMAKEGVHTLDCPIKATPAAEPTDSKLPQLLL